MPQHIPALVAGHEADLEIFRDRQLREEASPLRDIADPMARHFVGGQAAELDSLHYHSARTYRHEAHDRLERRRLAGAVAPQKAQDFARLKHQREIAQHLHVAIEAIKSAYFEHQLPR